MDVTSYSLTLHLKIKIKIKDINIHHEVIELLAIKEELTIQSLTDDIHIADGKTKKDFEPGRFIQF